MVMLEFEAMQILRVKTELSANISIIICCKSILKMPMITYF